MRSTPSNLSTIGRGTHDLGWNVGWSASKLLTELDSEHRVSGSGLPTCFPSDMKSGRAPIQEVTVGSITANRKTEA